MTQPNEPVVEDVEPTVEGDPTAESSKKPVKAADGLNADLAKERQRNKQLAEQLTKLQRANMDELERTKAEFADLKKENEEVTLERDKLKMALEMKMPWSLAKRITGKTLDEMREDAKELLATIKPEDDKGSDGGTGRKKEVKPPTNDNHAGKGGSGGTTDFDALLRSARKAH